MQSGRGRQSSTLTQFRWDNFQGQWLERKMLPFLNGTCQPAWQENPVRQDCIQIPECTESKQSFVTNCMYCVFTAAVPTSYFWLQFYRARIQKNYPSIMDWSKQTPFLKIRFLMTWSLFGQALPKTPALTTSGLIGNLPYIVCLTLPVSNALVEHVFSIVASTKTRNRMSLRMLDAVIRIRSHLHARGKCCRDLTITQSMLDRFSSAMYDSDSVTSNCSSGSCIIFSRR